MIIGIVETIHMINSISMQISDRTIRTKRYAICCLQLKCKNPNRPIPSNYETNSFSSIVGIKAAEPVAI